MLILILLACFGVIISDVSIAWKDLSPKWRIMCWAGRKTLLSHSLYQLKDSELQSSTRNGSRVVWNLFFWHVKCCSGQPNTSLPLDVPRCVQRAVHQLRLNRLTSAASYQAFIGRITSPICPHCGNGEETAEHLLLSCPRWTAECQHHFSDSIDIKDVFQDYVNLVEFFISLKHLPHHVGIAWWSHHINTAITTTTGVVWCFDWCRRVYLAYLDSINLFRPSHLRTLVYQQLLIAYFEYVRLLGWVNPPVLFSSVFLFQFLAFRVLALMIQPWVCKNCFTCLRDFGVLKMPLAKPGKPEERSFNCLCLVVVMCFYIV